MIQTNLSKHLLHRLERIPLVAGPGSCGENLAESENEVELTAKITERKCFICHGGDGIEALEGSGHPGDWVHVSCLARPVEWD